MMHTLLKHSLYRKGRHAKESSSVEQHHIGLGGNIHGTICWSLLSIVFLCGSGLSLVLSWRCNNSRISLQHSCCHGTCDESPDDLGRVLPAGEWRIDIDPDFQA